MDCLKSKINSKKLSEYSLNVLIEFFKNKKILNIPEYCFKIFINPVFKYRVFP